MNFQRNEIHEDKRRKHADKIYEFQEFHKMSGPAFKKYIAIRSVGKI
jgi:hypothetical protein